MAKYSKPPLKAIRYTKNALAARMASLLTDTANMADVYREMGDTAGAKIKQNQLDGMIILARDIGIGCGCPFIAGHKMFICSCNGQRPAGLQRRRRA